MLGFRIIAIALLILTYCPHAFGLNVVATFLPVYIFAKNVAGDRAGLALLVPPGTDIHEFSLRPADARTLDGADLIVLSGAGLDEHLVGGRVKKAVDASKGATLIKGDPHLWLDPSQAVRQVENIRDALVARSPENADYFKRNAAAYIERLKALDAEIESSLSALVGRRLITYHESFAYFARRYGFRYYSLTGPGGEQPLPRRLKEVYDMAEGQGIRALFREEQFPAEALERLKADLGVKVCALNTLETGRVDAGYYEEAMRANLSAILRCLGGR